MRLGARLSGMGNICELLINTVIGNKPKVLIGLTQKRCGKVIVFEANDT